MKTVVRIRVSCNPKDRLGGYSVTMGNTMFTGCASDTTAKRMELTALLDAIKHTPKSTEQKVLFVSTKSSYISHAFSSFRDWQKHGFRTKGGSEVANLDLWDQIIREAIDRNIRLAV